MTTVIAFHEIDDSDQWLSSPKREEFFGALGVSVRTFIDPGNPHNAAVLLEVPDMAALEEALQTQEAAEAMKADGVRADTLVILTEA